MFKNKITALADTSRLQIDQSLLYQGLVDGVQYATPDISWLELNHIQFNIEEAVKELHTLKQNMEFRNYPVGNNKTRYYYKGLSLTSFKDHEDKLSGSFYIYDKNKKIIGNEHYVGVQQDNIIAELNPEYADDFEQTPACTNFFQSILSQFKAPITRVRILELKPGGIIPPHVDYPYSYGIKLHAYLETNNDVWCEVAGERFQIPANGKFVWMDISKPHSVINLGNTSRYTLCVNLNPISDPRFKGKKIDYILNNI
jgi:quercetin dioxygenase-like cupin family protein